MAEASMMTDELKKLIGVPGEAITYKVEEGAIQRYAQAIGDPNPLYNDVEYAARSKHGRVMCPPRCSLSISPRHTMSRGAPLACTQPQDSHSFFDSA